MKTLLLLAVIMAFALLQVHGALWDFATMIKHTTGKTAPLSYGAYGCHCGLSGRGAPKDATDWCCWAHDCCYKKLKYHGCGTKLLNYNVSIRRGQITCEDRGVCRRILCECDKKAASCFAKNQNTYNKNLQYYSNLFCTGRAPQC
ncbi:phospholipase A2, membrane associated-like [Cervus elaphus]|uniref:phospholipase A2, membrane associated-like n=1 Tax=Cervus canadensis TaxID=1574408 RepID=UPI001CA3706E|nr:phospholipase A2, membrane associated-like [Cervus canadensis]XP_043764966.1 phospholipase A2, membrane associated-like [Cervus elaphus]